MARENTVFLHGQINDTPKLYVKPDGSYLQAGFSMKVMRRPFLTGEGQQNTGVLRIDYPIVITKDADLMKTCSILKKGDMVDIKGVLTTRDVNKSYICPNGHKNTQLGTSVFITPIFICRREIELSEEEGYNLLRQRSEISNNIMMIGTLCRDPVFYEQDNGSNSCMTQYQIASNRRYHIRDGHEEERTDYPWVKTVGKQGKDDYAHLKTGSTIFINGAIQTREIERLMVCEECGEQFIKKEVASELFPYSVEYLKDCVFENPAGTDEDAASEQDSEE